MKKRLLPTLLALAMALTMLPMAAFATAGVSEKGNNTISVKNGGTTLYYTDLATAFSEADHGATVTLLGEVTATHQGTGVKDGVAFMRVGRTITLDLNGNTLTSSDKYTLRILCGTLNIVDSATGGKITNTNSEADGATLLVWHCWDDDAGSNYNADKYRPTLNVKGGEITSTKGTAILVSAFTESANADETLTAENAKANVSISGGNVHNNNGEPAVYVRGSGAVLDVTGGVVNGAGNVGISGNGTDSSGKRYGGTEINVTGGEVSGDLAGIYQPQTGELNISGGSVNGKAGVVVRSGTVDITGGTITATGTDEISIGDSGNTVPAAGIVFDTSANYPGSDDEASKVTVSNEAVVNAANTEQPAVILVTGDDGGIEDAKAKLEVTGGTFNAPVDPEYLGEDLKFQAEDKDGNYTYHESFEDAKEAAGKDGGSVSMPSNGGDGDWTEVTEDEVGADVEYTNFKTPKNHLANGYFTITNGTNGVAGNGEIKDGDVYLVQIVHSGVASIFTAKAEDDELKFLCNFVKGDKLGVWQLGSEDGFSSIKDLNVESLSKSIVYETLSDNGYFTTEAE